MNEKVIELTKKDPKEILLKLERQEVLDISKYMAERFLEEIRRGLEGEVDYADAPFFELVDKLYKEYEIKGCYFCDRDIDGNATPFEYPDKTKVCLTCMLKAANLLVAFGIDPRSLFPMVPERKIQPVLYAKREVADLIMPSDN